MSNIQSIYMKQPMLHLIMPHLLDVQVARLATLSRHFKSLVETYFQTVHTTLEVEEEVDASMLARWTCLQHLTNIYLAQLSVTTSTLNLKAAENIEFGMICKKQSPSLSMFVDNPFQLAGDIYVLDNTTFKTVSLRLLGTGSTLHLVPDSAWTKDLGCKPYLIDMCFDHENQYVSQSCDSDIDSFNDADVNNNYDDNGEQAEDDYDADDLIAEAEEEDDDDYPHAAKRHCF